MLSSVSNFAIRIKSVVFIVLNFFGVDPYTYSLKRFIFKNGLAGDYSGKRKLLIEYPQVQSNLVALSIFLTAIYNKGDFNLISYRYSNEIFPQRGKFNRFRFKFSTLRYIGARKLLTIKKTPDSTVLEAFETVRRMQNPYYLELFEFEGILVGDLIYDVYLAQKSLPTIDFFDPDFAVIFIESLTYVKFLSEYMDSNDVEAVFISHDVYHYGIACRLAIKNSIDVFKVTSESIFRYNKDMQLSLASAKFYRKEFNALPKHEKSEGLVNAIVNLKGRLEGQINGDLPYTSVSPFSKNISSNETFIMPSDNFKILVTAHDFFDSIHLYGQAFYPDFLIWLNTLGQASISTNYDWYLKPHPDAGGRMINVLEDFCMKFTKFTLLQDGISHHDLIAQGIDLVLTVHGTIAGEFPHLGVPVVNASVNNPHADYDFSVTPKSRYEYEKLLCSLESIPKPISDDQIFEYYFMKHLYNLQSWIYRNYLEYLNDLGGLNGTYSYKSSGYFASAKNRHSIDQLIGAVLNFYESGDYRIRRSHFNSN